MNKPTQRRLAAIVSVDVVGYSRLMGLDEVGTLASLRAHRAELIDAKIAEHGGRIVKTMGDGLLLEFPSVVDATICAIEVQESMAARNADVADAMRIVFRIGINLGDIIIEGDDILGDGVNIAARIEALAEPGGVAISGRVHDDVRDRLAVAFTDAGEQSLKNISRPTRVWRWSADKSHVMALTPDSPTPLEPARASIAVVPFRNMSGDPDREYLADGMAEDIINALSKAANLSVIARNSAFSYKGRSVDAQTIGRELKVRYVLEGSIRSSGNRLRVSTQLIDTVSGDHVWVERYDRVVEDVFDLQDEITREVVTGLRVQLTDGESAATWNRGTRNIEAWRLIVQGHGEMFQFHAEGMLRAREVAVRARTLDPDYATAWALEGMTHWYEVRLGLADDRDASLALAVGCATKATALDAGNPSVIVQAAITSALLGRHEEALEVARRGLASNPGSADVRAVLGMCHDFNGDSIEAVGQFDEAKQLNPLHPIWYFSASARALDACGRRDEALRNVRDGLSRQPNNFPCLLQLASLLGRRGEIAEAARAVAAALRHSPRFTLGDVDQWLMSRNDAFRAEFKDGLRKAGLREG